MHKPVLITLQQPQILVPDLTNILEKKSIGCFPMN